MRGFEHEERIRLLIKAIAADENPEHRKALAVELERLLSLERKRGQIITDKLPSSR